MFCGKHLHLWTKYKKANEKLRKGKLAFYQFMRAYLSLY